MIVCLKLLQMMVKSLYLTLVACGPRVTRIAVTPVGRYQVHTAAKIAWTASTFVYFCQQDNMYKLEEIIILVRIAFPTST